MTLPSYEPMLAQPWRSSFTDDGWMFEVKWDGVRVILGWDGDGVSARTRRGLDLLPVFPELAAFRWPSPVVVDGEIVAMDDRGVPSFERLQRRLSSDRSIGVTVAAFDVLYEGEPLLSLPVEERRARLLKLEPGLLVVSEATMGEGEALFAAVEDRDLEGVVAKRLGSRYRPGVRSPDWRKISVVNRIRAVVGGFMPGEGGRSPTFGSLLLGLFDGAHLRYIGRVGTGFDARALRAVRDALAELEAPVSPFSDDIDGNEAVWVFPGLVARVAFKNWTRAGRLRAPVFEGFEITDPEAVTWDSEGPQGVP